MKARIDVGVCDRRLKCVAKCSKSAISAQETRTVVDLSRCDGCGECVDACPTGAITLGKADSERAVATTDFAELDDLFQGTTGLSDGAVVTFDKERFPEGEITEILCSSSFEVPFNITVDGGGRVRFRATSATWAGFDLTGATKTTFVGCEFVGFLTGVATATPNASVAFENCRFERCGTSVLASPPTGSVAITAKNTTFKNEAVGAIRVETTSATEKVEVVCERCEFVGDAPFLYESTGAGFASTERFVGCVFDAPTAFDVANGSFVNCVFKDVSVKSLFKRDGVRFENSTFSNVSTSVSGVRFVGETTFENVALTTVPTSRAGVFFEGEIVGTGTLCVEVASSSSEGRVATVGEGTTFNGDALDKYEPGANDFRVYLIDSKKPGGAGYVAPTSFETFGETIIWVEPEDSVVERLTDNGTFERFEPAIRADTPLWFFAGVSSAGNGAGLSGRFASVVGSPGWNAFRFAPVATAPQSLVGVDGTKKEVGFAPSAGNFYAIWVGDKTPEYYVSGGVVDTSDPAALFVDRALSLSISDLTEENRYKRSPYAADKWTRPQVPRAIIATENATLTNVDSEAVARIAAIYPAVATATDANGDESTVCVASVDKTATDESDWKVEIESAALRVGRGETPTFRARIAGSGSAKFDVRQLATDLADEGVAIPPASYTVWREPFIRAPRTLPPNPELLSRYSTAVEGFVDKAIPTGAFDATRDWNFEYTPDVRSRSPFAEDGVYRVEFKIYPKKGNPVVWRNRVFVGSDPRVLVPTR